VTSILTYLEQKQLIHGSNCKTDKVVFSFGVTVQQKRPK